MSTRTRRALTGLFLLAGLGLGLAQPAFSQGTAEPTLEELLDATDDVQRGTTTSHTLMEMHVKTDRYERTMKMESWSQGEDKTLIRILEPAKDAGTTTLKVDEDMWNYLPRVDRTMKVPPGMMGGSWMGSHFSNDDLVKENRLADEFDFELKDKVDGVYTIVCTAKPDAAVVWGKVVVKVREDKIPVSVEYFNEAGELERTMAFSDVRDFDGRTIPATFTLIPADKPEEFTRVTTLKMEFDVELDPKLFTLQALKE